jgi:hypothetical protein
MTEPGSPDGFSLEIRVSSRSEKVRAAGEDQGLQEIETACQWVEFLDKITSIP